MSSRDEILARVRRLSPPAVPQPELPPFAAPAPSFDAFAAALGRMGGRIAELADPTAPGAVAAWIAHHFPDAKEIASAVPEVVGTKRLADARSPRELDDVDVGVVRAAFGVTETGSVLLTERELQVEALGFLAQHLVVLLDPARLVSTVHDAYAEPVFATARYQILMTGPSATADIEGVLIHGAQGVRSLTVLPVPSSGSSAAQTGAPAPRAVRGPASGRPVAPR